MNFFRDAFHRGGGGGNHPGQHPQQNQPDGGGGGNTNWSQFGHNVGQMAGDIGRDIGGLFGGGSGGAAQQQQQQAAAEDESMKSPPASTRAIRTLPTVTVTPEDLVDPTNRECCICFEPHSLRDRVVRLPCAHIYHPPCIVDWLRRSCTCPVCRYELPTDVPAYEATRRRRMAGRRPRYAAYELRRLGPRELLDLAARCRVSLPGNGAGMERGDLVDSILKSGRIELISAPEPVEHRMSDLRALGVGKLRRTMEEAGVFFSKEDVVEKSDMVDLFVRSGRVALLPEEEDDDAGDDGDGNGIVMEEGDDGVMRDTSSPPKKKRSVVASRDEEGATWSEASSSQGNNSTDQGATTRSSSLMNMGGDNKLDRGKTVPSVIDMFGESNGTEPLPPPPPEAPAAAAAAAAGATSNSSAGSHPAPSAPPFAAQYSAMDEHQEAELDAALAAGSLPNVTRNTRISSYQSHSVLELRSIASGLGIDVSDCVEKREMVGRIADFEAYVDIDE